MRRLSSPLKALPFLCFFASVPLFSAASTRVWTIGDFDGDKKLERMEAWTTGQQVGRSGFHLSLSHHRLFASIDPRGSSPELSLIARDLDRDSDLDIILRDEAQGTTIALWMNDGRGSFSDASAEAWTPTILAAGNWLVDRRAGDSQVPVIAAQWQADLAPAAVRAASISLAVRLAPSRNVHPAHAEWTRPARAPPSLL